jgi:hypothetical protein
MYARVCTDVCFLPSPNNQHEHAFGKPSLPAEPIITNNHLNHHHCIINIKEWSPLQLSDSHHILTYVSTAIQICAPTRAKALLFLF